MRRDDFIKMVWSLLFFSSTLSLLFIAKDLHSLGFILLSQMMGVSSSLVMIHILYLSYKSRKTRNFEELNIVISTNDLLIHYFLFIIYCIVFLVSAIILIQFNN
jgi:hypothetical protein